MQWLTSSLKYCVILAVACWFSGCNGSRLPEGETGTVTGKVMFAGKPVTAGASLVMFHETTGLPAAAIISADGSYQMRMRGEAEILAGKYLVGISPPQAPAATTLAEQEAQYNSPGQADLPVYSDIPVKFYTPETSGVTLDVQPGENHFELDLKTL